MIKYRTDHGKKLVRMMQDGTIEKQTLPDKGKTFHGGYEQLYLENFVNYLGCVSRYLQNKRLKVKSYDGE